MADDALPSINCSMLAVILDVTLSEAARPLTGISPETFEDIATKYAEAVNSEEGKALPATAREKGLAMVGLLTAAAEFRRAASRYAKAVITHALAPEAPLG